MVATAQERKEGPAQGIRNSKARLYLPMAPEKKRAAAAEKKRQEEAIVSA